MQGNSSLFRRFRTAPGVYVASVGIAAILFIGDLLIPRGATPAIGYCAIPVLAGNARRREFLLAITIACSVLTGAGYFFEPAGAMAWMSIFDRIMILGVLWLTYWLVWRRIELLAAVTGQARILEETKRELERSNAELDSFASVIAHDLRGPLNTIGLLSRLLGDRRPPNSPDDSADLAANIQNEILSLSTLIQSLLNYGRVGGGEVHLADCDCGAVLDLVRHRLKSQLEENHAQVTNDSLPTLPADPALMQELFQNLIENSIKYRGAEPPRIHVSAVQSADMSRFFVRDNGIGIKPTDFQRIFQPFRQSRADSRSGIGLGLATCKRIVERHGGHIEVQSTYGKGTTFSFTIPMPMTKAIAAVQRPELSAVES